jgi:hypothetical protein
MASHDDALSTGWCADEQLMQQTGNRLASSYWSTLLASDDEFKLLVRKAASCASIVRWSFWRLGRGIHVSRMSEGWLRMYEVDYNKHGADM